MLLFGYIGIIIFLSIGLLIYYLIHIAKNPKFKQDSTSKLVWILIVLLAGAIGMLVYFFIEIWPEKKLEAGEFVP